MAWLTHLCRLFKGIRRPVLSVVVGVTLVTSMMPISALSAFADDVLYASEEVGAALPEDPSDYLAEIGGETADGIPDAPSEGVDTDASPVESETEDAIDGETPDEAQLESLALQDEEEIEAQADEAVYASGDGWAWMDATETGFVITGPGGFVTLSDMVNGTFDPDGDGTPESADDFSGKTVYLANDVDMSSVANLVPIGTEDTPFQGVFNGKGYTIRNLTINSSEQYVGLFGYIEGGDRSNFTRSVKSVTIENASITSTNDEGCAGALVGSHEPVDDGNYYLFYIYGCDVINSAVSGGAYTGGFMGNADSATIELSSFTGSVKASLNAGYSYAGGFVGNAYGEQEIFDSYVRSDTIEGDDAGALYAYSGDGANDILNVYAAVASDLPFFADDSIWYAEASFTTSEVESSNIVNVSVDEMKSTATIKELNNGFDSDDVYATWCADRDENPINGGFPVLIRQAKRAGFSPSSGSDLPETSFTWNDDKSILTLYNAADLIAFSEMVNGLYDSTGNGSADDADDFTGKTVLLANDIDMSGVSNFRPISELGHPFRGSFNGCGHSILNVTVNGGSNDYIGLFGYVQGGSKYGDPSISNFTLSGTFSGTTKVGAVAGYGEQAVIRNVHVKDVEVSASPASTTSGGAGGIIGWAYSDGIKIDECSVEGNISSTKSAAGGLIGYSYMFNKSISNSYVKATISCNDRAGGLIGWNAGAGCSIKDCWADATIQCTSANRGALIGYCTSGSTALYAVSINSSYGVSSPACGLIGYRAATPNFYVFSSSYATAGDVTGGISIVSDDDLKSMSTLEGLVAYRSGDENPWCIASVDGAYLNEGRPILKWQAPEGAELTLPDTRTDIWDADIAAFLDKDILCTGQDLTDAIKDAIYFLDDNGRVVTFAFTLSICKAEGGDPLDEVIEAGDYIATITADDDEYKGQITLEFEIVDPNAATEINRLPYTISKDGRYHIQEGLSTGVITIASGVKEVTLIGNGATWDSSGMTSVANTDVAINATAAQGINLTLQDVYLSNKKMDTDIINLAGLGNTICIQGTNVIDHDRSATGKSAIHVPTSASMEMVGAGTLYLYKYEQGSGIGGNTSESNGEMTFNMEGGKLFIKGSKQGAVIGAGSGAAAEKKIEFKAGTYNVIAVARGAAIGGGAGSTGGKGASDVRINAGVNMSIYVDYTGASIGSGGFDSGNDATGGTLTIGGATLRTYVTANSASINKEWAMGPGRDSITADIQDESKSPLALVAIDTSEMDFVAEAYDVVTDEGDGWVASGLTTQRYADINEALLKGAQAPVTCTPSNWVELPASERDPNLYIYLPAGSDHRIDVNGETFKAIWTADSTLKDGGSFAVERVRTESKLRVYDLGNSMSATLYDNGKLEFSGVNTVSQLSTIPWEADREKIKSVSFDAEFKGADLSNWFKDCINLEYVKNIPEGTTSLASTFEGCAKLANTPVIPSTVTNLSATFKGCSSITEAVLIPEGALNVSSMYENCPLITLIPSGFTIPAGISAASIFALAASDRSPVVTLAATYEYLQMQNLPWESWNREFTEDPSRIALPVITAQPSDKTVAKNASGKLSLKASPSDGKSPLDYLWYVADNANMTNKTVVANATSPEYTFQAGNKVERLYYQCVISIGSHEVASQVVSVLISDALVISTPEELVAFSAHVNGTDGNPAESFAGLLVMLNADIDLAGIDFTPIGVKETTPFKGTFDGNGHSILNLHVDGQSFGGSYIGLFNFVTGTESSRANICNLSLTGTLSLDDTCLHAGALVASAKYADISACSVNASVRSGGTSATSNAGGIVGCATSCTVSSCSFAGSVEGYANVGGLVGYLEASTLTDCVATGSVRCNMPSTTSQSMTGGAGGAVGEMISTSAIEGCAIRSDVSSSFRAGGIFGEINNMSADLDVRAARAKITDTYFNGTVRSDGGFSGAIGSSIRYQAAQAYFENVYSSAAVDHLVYSIYRTGTGSSPAFEVVNVLSLAASACSTDNAITGTYEKVVDAAALVNKVNSLNGERTLDESPWVYGSSVNDGMPMLKWEIDDNAWPESSMGTMAIDLAGGSFKQSQGTVFNYEPGMRMPEVERTGYEFEGWTSDPEGALVWAQDGAWMVADGASGYVSATPVWKAISYSITYMEGGKKLENTGFKSQYTIEDETYIIPTPDERNGFAFRGWFTGPEGTGDAVSEIKQGSTGDIVVYAFWIEDDGSDLEQNADGVWEIRSMIAYEQFRDAVNGGNKFSGETVALCINLSLAGENVTPIGTITNPFAGIFDGQGHAVKSMTISSTTGYQGFFGSIAGTVDHPATVKNLDVDGSVTVSQNSALGGICGSSSNAVFENCTFIGEVASKATNLAFGSNASKVAGVVGTASGVLQLTDCHVQGTFSGFKYVGGLVGTASGTTSILQCSSESVVTSFNATSTSQQYFGVLVGEATGTSLLIESSYAKGSVSAAGAYIGGAVGAVEGSCALTVRSCFSDVSASYLQNTVITPISGVFLGYLATTATGNISNSYIRDSSGNITNSVYSSAGKPELQYVYRERTDGVVEEGITNVTSDVLKAPEMIDNLNSGLDPVMWRMDREGEAAINEGYPILIWMDDTPVMPVEKAVEIYTEVTGLGTIEADGSADPGDKITVSAQADSGSYLAQIRWRITDAVEDSPAALSARGIKAQAAQADDAAISEIKENALLTAQASSDDEAPTFTAAEFDSAGKAVLTVPSDIEEGKAISVVADFIPIVWDGTLDLTWYDESSSSFTLQYASQYEGLAAMVNGLFTTYPTDAAGKPDTAAYEKAMGIDGDKQGSLYAEFEGTYTINDSQSDYAPVSVIKTTRVVGDGSLIKATSGTSSTAGGNNEVSSDTYWFGAADSTVESGFANKTVLIGADLDFGGMKGAGGWSTSSPLFMSLGGQYTMAPNNTNTIIGSSWNGVLDGCGHNFNNVYAERYSATAYGDASTLGLIGRIGVHDNDTLIDAAPAARQIVLASGLISSRRSVGGIVGKIGQTTVPAVIEYCINKADVIGTDKKGVGGIVGASWNKGVIRYCANFGSVSCDKNEASGFLAGGIVGSNEVPVQNCYNVGTIKAGLPSFAMAIGTNNASIYEVENCWFLEGCASGGGYFDKSSDNTDNGSTSFKAGQLSAATMNGAGGDIWMSGTANTFGGYAYPVLYFQNGTVDTNKQFKVEIASVDHANISASASSGVYGDTIELSCTPEAGWALESYVVNGKEISGSAFALTADTTVSANMRQRTTSVFSFTNSLADKCDVTFTKTGVVIEGGVLKDVENLSVKDGDTLYDGDVLSMSVKIKEGAAPDDSDRSYNGVYRFYVNDSYEQGVVSKVSLITVPRGLSSFAVKLDALDTEQKTWSAIADISWFDENNVMGAYTISSAAELAGLAELVSSGYTFEGVTISLASNISLADASGGLRLWNVPIGVEGNPFKGTFDGCSFCISDMTAGLGASALFGNVDSATVKNLTVGGSVDCQVAAAGIVLSANASTILNCTNEAAIKGSGANVAGIVASATASTVKDCVNKGSIENAYSSATSATGGIVGLASSSVIDGCENEASVTGGGYTGGIAGAMTGTSTCAITSSNNSGDVSASSTSNVRVGGIAGMADATNATIRGCENSGEVSAEGFYSYAAGILGDAAAGITIRDSKSEGEVSASASDEDKALIAQIASSSKGEDAVTVTVRNVEYNEESEIPVVANCSLLDKTGEPEDEEPIVPPTDAGDSDDESSDLPNTSSGGGNPSSVIRDFFTTGAGSGYFGKEPEAASADAALDTVGAEAEISTDSEDGSDVSDDQLQNASKAKTSDSELPVTDVESGDFWSGLPVEYVAMGATCIGLCAAGGTLYWRKRKSYNELKKKIDELVE